ncbi:MAG: uncharacterized protein QOE70_2385 [Chthoniobacter sp.]|jgi:uncharacterized protein YyaL (SSP411 family)|nr:uncharacterized protein [Chthoniobacter sp.]
MKTAFRFASLGVLLASALIVPARAADPLPAIDWQPWSEGIFEKAKRENRFVLLDLGAVWCHWCHVMYEITYADPAVIALVKSRYIAVRVDQDSRPDLSNRYEDYGWPATIVFNTDGSEIVKRRGYLPPKPMASMLEAIIDDPTPGPSVEAEPKLEPSGEGALDPKLREKLRALLVSEYDAKNHGWGSIHKFVDWDVIEYCLAAAGDGDREFERMARETLAAGRKLIDPVWGGVYQYSTDGDWEHPHFEKIMQMQAENLRTYSLAYARWRDPADLQATTQIRAFLQAFLTSPDGAFFTSQDADLVPGEHAGEFFALNDEGRRKQGVPRIDRHIYSRENGWAIHGLAALYAATGDRTVLDDALRAAEWIIAQRGLPGGGFRHDAADLAGPYLGDNVFMARGLLSLYAVTSERSWLARAEQALHFADTQFRGDVGYVTSAGASALKPKPQVDENVAMARLASLLQHYTGKAEYRAIAEHAMRFVAAPMIADQRGFQVGGILLAGRELVAPPLHVTITGHKDDPAALALFRAGLALPSSYKRVEWWDRREGPMPNLDVQYPELPKAAAFVCTARSCSAPIFTPEKISAISDRIGGTR